MIVWPPVGVCWSFILGRETTVINMSQTTEAKKSHSALPVSTTELFSLFVLISFIIF